MPKRLVNEISVGKPNLYEIEIKEVDVPAQRLEIYFKGYDEKFDEWRPFTDGSLPFVRLEKCLNQAQTLMNVVIKKSSVNCFLVARTIQKFVSKFL